MPEDRNPAGSSDAAPSRCVVVAPLGFWIALEEETGGVTPTREFISRWVCSNGSGRSVLIAEGAAEVVGNVNGDSGERRDYCAACERGRGCSRLEVIATPHALLVDEGGWVTAHFKCEFDHSWSCNFSLPDSA